MFGKSTDWYDAVYQAIGKDYRREAAEVAARIRVANPSARSLLDVACGTGRHLEFLAAEFDSAGIDLQPEFVEQAARRCPAASVSVADMRNFDLGREFDAVVCLFSSIGYARTRVDLHRAVAAMARHLRPGGVLVIEPFVGPDRWRPGAVTGTVAETEHGTVARVVHSSRDGDVAVMGMHYLVGTGEGVRHLTERHELGLFDIEDHLHACRAAGLDGTAERHGLIGRGLVTAIRR